MNDINEIRNRIKNKKVNTNNKNNFLTSINNFLIKLFIVVFIILIGGIIVKKDVNIKNNINNYLYSKNISFAKIKSIYNKYIGDVLPFDNVLKETKVFNEKLKYDSLSRYNDGVKLKVSNNYAIPCIKGGIVIFVGEKENIGNSITIQQSDGIEVTYGNLSNINVKLYDYIDDKAIIGEAKNNTLYILFLKDGVSIDYKEVLK